MKTFAEVIKDDFKKILTSLAILIAASVAGFSFYNLRETVGQEKVLILNFVSTIAAADLMQGDILEIDKDLGRFGDTLLLTRYPSARIGVWLNDKKVGSFGPQRPFKFLAESFEENTDISVGNTIKISVQMSELNYILWSLLSLVLLEGFLFLAYHALSKKIALSSYVITQPLSQIVAEIREIASHLPDSTKRQLHMDSANILEVDSLNQSINTLLKEITALQSDLEKTNIDRGRLQVAEYVHHNVMGPLGTLEMIANNFVGLSGTDRGRLLDTVGRIRDTITTLETGAINQGAIHVPTILEKVLAEKRISYREKSHIEIKSQGLDVYDAFISGSKSELSAIVSNLIDNSVEAMSGPGHVTLSLLCSEKEIIFEVTDNGKGIPEAVLSKLGSSRISHGKKGKGLGLVHAKETVSAWNGAIEFTSPTASGTMVKVRIPRANPPPWFALDFTVQPGTEIVIIDDDPAIHERWNERLTTLGDVIITHFISPTEFRESMTGRNLQYEKRVYLMDHEFKGYEETGLSLVKQFKIQLETYLVTGRYSDEKIVEAVKAMGLRQIPKEFMDRVPIRLDQDTAESQETHQQTSLATY